MQYALKIYLKVALGIAAAAQAAPAADPQLLLANPLVYNGNAHTQTLGGLVQHANGAVVPVDTLSVKAARLNHLNSKAAVAYMNTPHVHFVHQPIVQSVANPMVSNTVAYPYFYNTHLFKREAEAARGRRGRGRGRGRVRGLVGLGRVPNGFLNLFKRDAEADPRKKRNRSRDKAEESDESASSEDDDAVDAGDDERGNRRRDRGRGSGQSGGRGDGRGGGRDSGNGDGDDGRRNERRRELQDAEESLE